MDYIFYFFAIFAIMWEFGVIKETNMIISYISEYSKKTKSEMNGTDKTFSVLMMGYTLWSIIGLFTSQWPLFLLLLIMSFIQVKRLFLLRLDAVISLLILLFIVLNKFHFKIDVISIF